MKTTTAIAFAALALAGCGEAPPTPDHWTPGGIGIKVEPGAAEWAQAPDLGERVDAIAAKVEDITDAPRGALSGTLVVLTGSLIEYDGLPRAGLYYSSGRYALVSTRDPGHWSATHAACLELVTTDVRDTALAHELFHALIGDNAHTDPRWGLVGWHVTIRPGVTEEDCH